MSTGMKKALRMVASMAVLLAMLCTTVFAEQAAVTFTDVSGHWAEGYIGLAAQRKLIQGYNGLYQPDDNMTRAQLVTILWRAQGEPKPDKDSGFTDLTQDWYKDAVAWAKENGIVQGVSTEKFNPEGNVTREQLAVILHRMAGGTSGMELLFTSIYDDHFTDEQKASSWAKASLYWCIFNEVYCGTASEKVGDTLAPDSDATRGQIAVMIIRYLDRNN